MKKFALLLMLVYPVLSWAQVDDLYYVPKKEKTVLVVKSAEDVYFVGDNDVVIEDDVEDVYITDDSDGYYTNDLYDVVDDYTYSTRIIRFHSPRKRRGSSGCGRDSRASSRVEPGMMGNYLSCSKGAKDPLEVPEVRCD